MAFVGIMDDGNGVGRRLMALHFKDKSGIFTEPVDEPVENSPFSGPRS